MNDVAIDPDITDNNSPISIVASICQPERLREYEQVDMPDHEGAAKNRYAATLRHHQGTVALAGYSLAASPFALERIEQREQALGIRFPASLREWYALDPPPGLLGLGDNQDRPYDVMDLGKPEGGHSRIPRHDPLTQGYLVIMNENQSVVRWAVRLDGSDDPPVLLQHVRPDGPWHHHADKFSTFAYTRVWDYQASLREYGCRVETGIDAADPVDVEWLCEHYQEGPRTYAWPYEVAYRFTHPTSGARILLFNSATGDTVTGAHESSYWYIWAEDEHSLEGSVRDVWNFGTLARDLWDSNNECGRRILDRLQP